MADPCSTAQDQGSVEAHLAACGDCSVRLAELALSSQLVRSALTGAADEVDWKAFTDRVMDQVRPAQPSFRERLERLWSSLLPQGGMGWAVAGAAGVALVAGVASLGLGGNAPKAPPRAGYGADTMAVKAVQAEPDVSPVVMEADQGGAIIFLVDHPQAQPDQAGQPADAGTPKAAQEEGGDL
jgi:anti-sigma factor RsiW